MDGCEKEFAALWTAACDAIRKATGIFFIGYRFPETDAYSRETLLAAIGDNRNVKDVRIVLGTNQNAPDIVRVEELLSTVCGPSVTRAVPLWAEDFLSTYVRRDG